MSISLQQQLAQALKKRREDEMDVMQREMLNRLKWPESQKGLLSKIEGGMVPIPWGAIASLAHAYKFDPALVFILRAATELADEKLQESTANRVLLASILELAGVQPDRPVVEVLAATAARKLVAEVNVETARHHIVAAWKPELQGNAVMPPVRLGIQHSCYQEVSSSECLQKPGVLVLVASVRHGLGLQIAELLRTLQEDPLRDRLIVVAEPEDVGEDGGFHHLIRSAIQHTLTLMDKGEQISTIFPQESQSLNDVPATVVVLKADRLPSSFRNLTSDGRHTLVLQFDEPEKAALFSSSNPQALIATVAPIAYETALSVLEGELLRTTTSALRSEAFLASPYWQLLRQPCLLFSTLTVLRESPATLPTRTQVLEAAAQTFQWEPISLTEWTDDDTARVSTPLAGAEKSAYTLLVEDSTIGRALATLINSGNPDELGGKIRVVLAPYSLVLSALNANKSPASEIKPDIVVVQHYAQFLTHLELGHFVPLGQLPHDATHSPFASICRQGDQWYGAPFQYPTKVTAYRKFAFAPGQEPTNWATIPASLGTAGRGSKLLLQLAKDHPCLYYEWLAIVLGMGGCDVLRSIDGDLMVLLDSPQTIAATQKFQQLTLPRFSHPESKRLDWYTINDAFSDLGDAVALCFPFSDTIGEVIDADERRKGALQLEPQKDGGDGGIGWCHLPTYSATEDGASELARSVFGTSGFPLHPSTMHIVACVNKHAAQATESLLLWLHGTARRRLSLQSVDPGVDEIVKLAERYLLPPIVGPRKLVAFKPKPGLAQYQAVTLNAINTIVHKNASVEATLRDAAKEIRHLIK